MMAATDSSEGGQRAGGTLGVLVRTQETCNYLYVHEKQRPNSSLLALCQIV